MSDNNQEHQKIINLYGLFGASIVLSIIPFASAMALSVIFFIILLVWVYRIRKKADKESLSANHSIYIMRTLWITALFSLITMALASAYMLPNIHYEPFLPCSHDLTALGMKALEGMRISEMYPYIEPCLDVFVDGNYTLFVNAALIAGMPLMIYMGYRFTVGLSRAIKGYRLAKPHTWF